MSYRPTRDIMELACGFLPADWQIEIHLEQGAGLVRLIDPDGDEIDMCDDDLNSVEMVMKRINHARQSDGLEPIEVPNQ